MVAGGAAFVVAEKQRVSPLRSQSLASVEMTGGRTVVVRRSSLAGQRKVSPLRLRSLASVDMTGRYCRDDRVILREAIMSDEI